MIVPKASVASSWVLAPEFPDTVKAPSGMLSGVPSATKEKLPPARVPPSTLQLLPSSILSNLQIPRLWIVPSSLVRIPSVISVITSRG